MPFFKDESKKVKELRVGIRHAVIYFTAVHCCSERIKGYISSRIIDQTLVELCILIHASLSRGMKALISMLHIK